MTATSARLRPHVVRATRRAGIYGRQGSAGWLFVAPAIVILGLFLLLPIVMALFVSFTKWNGQGSPFTARFPWPAPTTAPTCSPRTGWPASTS